MKFTFFQYLEGDTLLSNAIWQMFSVKGQVVNNFGEGNGNPLQYSCLENPMDGEAWWAIVHGVAKSRTRLRDFTSTSTESQGASLVAQLVKNLPAMQETWVQSLGWEDPLEKEMAIHSSILAWRIPRTEKPGGL